MVSRKRSIERMESLHCTCNGAPQPTTTAHCPIVAPALHCLHASFTRIPPSFPRRREPRIPAPAGPFSLEETLCITHRGASRSPSKGECRGAMPHCRGRGGVPHKHTGRVGGKNHVRQAQLRKGLLRGEGKDEGEAPSASLTPAPRRRQGMQRNATKCN